MLLDTTVLIDFLRGREDAVNVIEKVESAPLFTTEINVFELITGVYISKKKVQPHLEKLFALLSKMIVLPFDRRASLKAGKIAGTLIRDGKKIEETDCLIAGIALANGITEIITTNKKHFEKISQLKVITY